MKLWLSGFARFAIDVVAILFPHQSCMILLDFDWLAIHRRRNLEFGIAACLLSERRAKCGGLLWSSISLPYTVVKVRGNSDIDPKVNSRFNS